jgi:hypothetical protein
LTSRWKARKSSIFAAGRKGTQNGEELMAARIYRPAKTAMSSGQAKAQRWLLEYEPERPKAIEPLMGYTASDDMKSQIRLEFDTREQAIGYAERNAIPYRVFSAHDQLRSSISYSDNFRRDRRQPWTH